MSHHDVIYEVESRMAAAQARYGPFTSTHEAIGVALEEWDELRAALHANALGAIEHECLDLAAVCLRLAISIRNGDKGLIDRSTK